MIGNTAQSSSDEIKQIPGLVILTLCDLVMFYVELDL